MTLVIMAAGMGSRFGGLKQIEPVGPNGEFIIDYSIYDAIQAGFDKVVFIIKEENYDIFRDTIGKRIEGKIQVNYVFQDNRNVPSDVELPSTRVKPLGTGQAILFCKDIVNEPFVIINADDFYGREAYEVAAKYIKENTDEYKYGLIGYHVVNTLAAAGAVKRGVCEIKDNKLVKLIESSVEKIDGVIKAKPLDGSDEFVVPNDCKVSMNMFAFYPNLFKYLEEDFDYFLRNTSNLEKAEFLIPDIVFDHLKKNDIECEVLENTAVWKGITYKEDLIEVKDYIKEEIERGVYPIDLYK